MAGRGRPRKPHHLHIAEGTLVPCRHDPDNAIIATGTPEMPPGLRGEARKFWKAWAVKLAGMGAAEVDSAELASMCEWWGRYRALARKRMPKDMLDAKRLLDGLKLAWREFDHIAARFGLTPSDRARLKITPKPVADEFEDMLNGRKKHG